MRRTRSATRAARKAMEKARTHAARERNARACRTPKRQRAAASVQRATTPPPRVVERFLGGATSPIMINGEVASDEQLAQLRESELATMSQFRTVERFLGGSTSPVMVDGEVATGAQLEQLRRLEEVGAPLVRAPEVGEEREDNGAEETSGADGGGGRLGDDEVSALTDAPDVTVEDEDPTRTSGADVGGGRCGGDEASAPTGAPVVLVEDEGPHCAANEVHHAPADADVSEVGGAKLEAGVDEASGAGAGSGRCGASVATVEVKGPPSAKDVPHQATADVAVIAVGGAKLEDVARKCNMRMIWQEGAPHMFGVAAGALAWARSSAADGYGGDVDALADAVRACACMLLRMGDQAPGGLNLLTSRDRRVTLANARNMHGDHGSEVDFRVMAAAACEMDPLVAAYYVDDKGGVWRQGTRMTHNELRRVLGEARVSDALNGGAHKPPPIFMKRYMVAGRCADGDCVPVWTYAKLVDMGANEADNTGFAAVRYQDTPAVTGHEGKGGGLFITPAASWKDVWVPCVGAIQSRRYQMPRMLTDAPSGLAPAGGDAVARHYRRLSACMRDNVMVSRTGEALMRSSAKVVMARIVAQVAMEWAVGDVNCERFGLGETNFMQLAITMFGRRWDGTLMEGSRELAKTCANKLAAMSSSHGNNTAEWWTDDMGRMLTKATKVIRSAKWAAAAPTYGAPTMRMQKVVDAVLGLVGLLLIMEGDAALKAAIDDVTGGLNESIGSAAAIEAATNAFRCFGTSQEVSAMRHIGQLAHGMRSTIAEVRAARDPDLPAATEVVANDKSGPVMGGRRMTNIVKPPTPVSEDAGRVRSRTYDDVMEYMGARVLPTSGAGNLCLFNALVGETGPDGIVKPDARGITVALRTQAGMRMRSGYARSLHPGGDDEWQRDVEELIQRGDTGLTRGAGPATVAACAAVLGRDIVRADVFLDKVGGGRGTTAWSCYKHREAAVLEVEEEEAKQAVLRGALVVVWVAHHFERVVTAFRPAGGGYELWRDAVGDALGAGTSDVGSVSDRRNPHDRGECDVVNGSVGDSRGTNSEAGGAKGGDRQHGDYTNSGMGTCDCPEGSLEVPMGNNYAGHTPLAARYPKLPWHKLNRFARDPKRLLGTGLKPLPDRFTRRALVTFAGLLNWMLVECRRMDRHAIQREAAGVDDTWDPTQRETVRILKRAASIGKRCSANGLGGWSCDLLQDLMSGRAGMAGVEAAAKLLSQVQADQMTPVNNSPQARGDMQYLNILVMAAPQILFGGLSRKVNMARMSGIVDKRMRMFVNGEWDDWLRPYDKPRGDTSASPDIQRCLRYIREGAELSKGLKALIDGPCSIIELPEGAAIPVEAMRREIVRLHQTEEDAGVVRAEHELNAMMDDMGPGGGKVAGAINGGFMTFAMEQVLRVKQTVVIGKAKGHYIQRMRDFRRECIGIAAMEAECDLTPARTEELTVKLQNMVRGAFRPTLIPHPIMRVHGRVILEMARNEVSGWLGGVGYGACVTGGADNLVAMARLMWDTGGVYSVSDVCSGYPRGQVHEDFTEVAKFADSTAIGDVVKRAFLLHFGKPVTLCDAGGKPITKMINGYAQGGTLDALMFQLGMKQRLEGAAATALGERCEKTANNPQAIPGSYIDDTGIAAKSMDSWCEYFRHVADDFEPKDNQIICSSLTRQEMVDAMRAGGVNPDTFPVIVGKPERGSEPAGIVVLGVPVGNEEFLEQYATSKTGDLGDRDTTARGACSKVQTLDKLGGEEQARLLLLRHCASTLCLHMARALPSAVYTKCTRYLDLVIEEQILQVCGVPPSIAPSPRGTGGGHEWRNAVRECRVGVRAILAMQQARSPMAMGGLGIMKLNATRAAIAGMCAAAGALARMGTWLRELRGWGAERNANMPMCGYQWITLLISQALEPPGAAQGGGRGGILRQMMVDGWQCTQQLHEDKGRLQRDEKHEFEKLITRTVYASRFGVSNLRRVTCKLPEDFNTMVKRAAKPGLQHDIVTHSHAMDVLARKQKARIFKKTDHNLRLEVLRAPGSTALLCAVPSAGFFSVGQGAFSYAMRSRLGLPALMGAKPGVNADEYANQIGSARVRRHDAVVKALCYSATFSDLVARTEPRHKYACHNGTDCSVTPDVAVLGRDGVHDTADIAVVAEKKGVPRVVHIKKYGKGSVRKYGEVRLQEGQVLGDLARQRRQGIISGSEYDAAARASNVRKVDAYHPGYLGPCSFAGDRFHAVMLTPHGGWWQWGRGECNEFLQRTTHTGDDIADCNLEAERFDHHARTWASWTHHAFTRQMVACAMASGTYAGVTARSREMLRAQSYGLGNAAALYEPNVAPPCPGSDAA